MASRMECLPRDGTLLIGASGKRYSRSMRIT
jgi:hypothetical protein